MYTISNSEIMINTVYREEGKYCSFPHMVKYEDRIICVFRRASHFSVMSAMEGKHTHHDPDSEICQIESYDNGESWDQESFKVIYKSEFGVNDPSLTVLKNGSILLRFVALKIEKTEDIEEFPKKIFSHRSEHGLVTEVVNNLLLISSDGGKTWKDHGEIKSSITGPSCSRDPLIQLSDGSLLASVYTGAPQRSDISWVLRSFDNGKTWGEETVLGIDRKGQYSQLQGINYNETSLLDMGSGEIYALIRGDESFHTDNEFMPVGGIGKLYISRSLDSGLCWTRPIDTGIFGQPGQIILLQSGEILCTYGYRKTPFGVRAIISKDNGTSWELENEIIIEEGFNSWDCGYPFTLELQDGSILTAYYANEPTGERTIKSKIWKL